MIGFSDVYHRRGAGILDQTATHMFSSTVRANPDRLLAIRLAGICKGWQLGVISLFYADKSTTLVITERRKRMDQGTQTLAVVFADISGNTLLYKEIGDPLALEKVGQCMNLLTEIIKRNKGQVIKTIGDEIMGTFSDSNAAVLAASEMQKEISEGFSQDGEMIRLKIGLNFGQVMVEGGDVFGDSVNTAAGLVAMANPGQILTSGATIEALSASLSAKTRSLGRFPFKGRQEQMDVSEVLAESSAGDSDLTLVPGKTLDVETLRVLLLSYRDQKVRLHEEDQIVLLGRDANSDLVVDEQLTSRLHARVEYRHGKFTLIDQSTNGTFVLTDEGEAIHVRREKLVLLKAGQISLGKKFEDDPTELIQFTHKSLE